MSLLTCVAGEVILQLIVAIELLEDTSQWPLQL